MWEKQVRLTLRWMFEAAVGDGAQKFSFEQEVAETSGMDSDVAALLVGASARDSQVTLLIGISISCGRGGSGGGGRGGLKLLVGVVDQIFFVRHDCGWFA